MVQAAENGRSGGTAGSQLHAKIGLRPALYDWSTADLGQDVVLYQALASSIGGPVLELGCGTGRVLQGLAAANVAVTGVDRSPAMLRRARRNLRAATSPVQLILGDMVQVRPRGPFGLVILARHTLGYLRRHAQCITLLRRVHSCLSPRGLLALDLVNPMHLAEQHARVLHGRTGRAEHLGGRVVQWSHLTLDGTRSEFDFTNYYAVAWDGGTATWVRDHARMRLFLQQEIRSLLRTAGFELVGIYGNYDLGASNDGERMFVLAEANPSSL